MVGEVACKQPSGVELPTDDLQTLAAVEGPDHTTSEKPPSLVAKLKENVAVLEQENHRLKSLTGGNAFTSKDCAADVVRILVSTFSPNKLTEIRSLLGKEIKR
jgi:hypothetical protein